MANAGDDQLEKHLDELQAKIDEVISFTRRISKGELAISFEKRIESQLRLQKLPEKMHMAEKILGTEVDK